MQRAALLPSPAAARTAQPAPAAAPRAAALRRDSASSLRLSRGRRGAAAVAAAAKAAAAASAAAAAAPSAAAAAQAAAAELLQRALLPHPGLLAGAAVNSLVFAAGLRVLLKGLTPAGVAHSWALGAAAYAAFGAGGYALVCAYFLAGTAVTRVRLEQKQREGIAEARSGRRGPASVWGSGCAGAACALAALASGSAHPWQVGFVASFASKLSDTVSSEIGKAFGRSTFLITTLQAVPRGTEGAVSAEGTAAGVAAAVLFAAAAAAAGQVSGPQACVVAAAAVAANVFESFLGASEQGKLPWLTNDVVNGIQITLAAALAIAGASLLPA